MSDNTCWFTNKDTKTEKGKKKARNTFKIISGTGPYLDAREKTREKHV